MASLVANIDIDPAFRIAIKLLHSPSPDSAEKIRNALDEIIKQRYGSTKMLVNTLNKKVIAEESTVPGTRVRSKSIETKQTVTTASGIAVAVIDMDAQMGDVITVPQGMVVEVPDEMETDDNENTIEDDQFKEFENLMCIVCHQVDVSVRNPLVECIDCHSLYHQDCHKPTISEADANGATWICTMCKSSKLVATTPIITVPVQPLTPLSAISSSTSINPAKSSSSSSHSSSGYQSKSSSSSSSSKNYESSSEKKSKSSSSSRNSPSTSSSKERSSSSKTGDRSSSSSSSKQQSDREFQSGNGSGSGSNLDRQTSSGSSSSSSSGNGAGGSSSSKSVTPSINIISADKRLQIMKKKAAKMHETKRSKHK